jgi:hypothetical protein
VKNTLFLLIALICFTKAFTQRAATAVSEIVSAKQVTEIFPDTVRKILNINFPIHRVYRYVDKAEEQYCILMESRDTITENKDTLKHTIKAINVKPDKSSFVKVWKINDNINNNENEENSIWFWTKYIDFKDFDGDSLRRCWCSNKFNCYNSSVSTNNQSRRVYTRAGIASLSCC